MMNTEGRFQSDERPNPQVAPEPIGPHQPLPQRPSPHEVPEKPGVNVWALTGGMVLVFLSVLAMAVVALPQFSARHLLYILPAGLAVVFLVAAFIPTGRKK